MNKVEIAFNKGYRVDRGGAIHGLKGQLLVAIPNGRGYRCFTLCLGGAKRKNIMIHRLQAFQKFGQEIFQGGTQVRHLNGDKLDNSWDNITIGTASENMMDIPAEVRHTMAVKANRNRRKLSVEGVLEMRRLYKEEGWKQTELAAKFGVSQPTVSSIINRKKWRDV